MKSCPSCNANNSDELVQCVQCGIIFSKWRDPKLKAAEARLLELGKEAGAGFPLWMKTLFLSIIGIPLLIIFVPDIGVPLLGGNLKYRFSKDRHIKHEGISSLIVSVPTVGKVPSIIDQLELKLETSLHSTETDFGGNTSLKKTFDRLSLNSALSDSNELTKTEGDLAGWSNEWIMNAHGGSISTLASTNNQLRTNLQAFQMHQQIRADRATNGLPPNSPASQPSPDTSLLNDPYRKIFMDMNVIDLGSLDMAAGFQYPKARARPGFSWKQQVHAVLRSKWFAAEIDEPITYTLLGFKRDGLNYLVRIVWEAKLEPHLLQTDNMAWPLLSDGILVGTYSGTAWVNYRDGIVQKCEGEFDLTLNPTLGSTPPLLQMLGLPGTSASGLVTPLQMKVNQKLTRL